ncbi:hypothetical protein HD597_007065 [Nonomuraea thailandensis]|uniref:Uncharacterized protein n=1 Tax=Nonomuraea thailandensis TaxID=1188745 RepID=A0A9X2GLL7_9ACTN|nr:hypothetical protein [Nonomuraea thailandensis]MCP2360045.1 hypothetical protein [Nonomuraea thailandensis]
MQAVQPVTGRWAARRRPSCCVYGLDGLVHRRFGVEGGAGPAARFREGWAKGAFGQPVRDPTSLAFSAASTLSYRIPVCPLT